MHDGLILFDVLFLGHSLCLFPDFLIDRFKVIHHKGYMVVCGNASVGHVVYVAAHAQQQRTPSRACCNKHVKQQSRLWSTRLHARTCATPVMVPSVTCIALHQIVRYCTTDCSSLWRPRQDHSKLCVVFMAPVETLSGAGPNQARREAQTSHEKPNMPLHPLGHVERPTKNADVCLCL